MGLGLGMGGIPQPRHITITSFGLMKHIHSFIDSHPRKAFLQKSTVILISSSPSKTVG
jgi:hypothetical protein